MKRPKKTTRVLEKVETARPARRPNTPQHTPVRRRRETCQLLTLGCWKADVGYFWGCNAPIMLPALSCRTAFPLSPPSDLITGVRASWVYCLKLQSLGLTEVAVVSRRSTLRDWKAWCTRKALETPRPAAKMGERRWKSAGLRMREAIVLGVWGDGVKCCLGA